jgi:hypothetical protein
MAHTTSCGKAKTPTCRCGGCAGSRHGWPGALMLAQPAMAAAGVTMHRAAEQAWADATRPDSKATFRPRPLRKQARAAVDCAKDEVENWLADTALNPSAATTELVSAVRDVATTDILDALCGALDPVNSNKNRAELARNHLFCQLLAEVACSMQDVRNEIDRAVKRIGPPDRAGVQGRVGQLPSAGRGRCCKTASMRSDRRRAILPSGSSRGLKIVTSRPHASWLPSRPLRICSASSQLRPPGWR